MIFSPGGKVSPSIHNKILELILWYDSDVQPYEELSISPGLDTRVKLKDAGRGSDTSMISTICVWVTSILSSYLSQKSLWLKKKKKT